MSRSSRNATPEKENVSLAQKNLDRTRGSEEKSDTLSSLGERFAEKSKSKNLQQKGWKVVINALRTAAAEYNKKKTSDNFKKFEEALKDACQLMRLNEQSKRAVYKEKVRYERIAELQKYKTEITTAYADSFIFTDVSIEAQKEQTEESVITMEGEISPQSTSSPAGPIASVSPLDRLYNFFKCCDPDTSTAKYTKVETDTAEKDKSQYISLDPGRG